MAPLTNQQFERLFEDPFSKETLQYMRVLLELVIGYNGLVEGGQRTYQASIFTAEFWTAILLVKSELEKVRKYIIRYELDSFGVYRELMEQKPVWM